ncbi:MAG: tRNA 2-thiouridine(34) synthase MnmA [Myxococcota bacterium]|nr:tRNA 2-thiouridine(34) synthase MnmA [Myxococcota bacterium]
MRRLEGGRKRILVAMSGGVDSSTVAGLLVEAGHDVFGVLMKLYDNEVADTEARQCCGLDDVEDARRVADHLGIPFYVVNYQEVFQEQVIDRFVDDYVNGRTPNPCVRCNDHVKFEPLLERARALGADLLATGHYAQTRTDEEGRVSLWRGRDTGKDPRYFLAGISAEALERVVFPLGGLSKDEVRHHAERLGLPVAQKRDSQEICFVPGDDYAAFVESRAGDRLPGPGAIVSLDGTRLGRHSGLHRYTVGQRKGLGISAGAPLYVANVDLAENQLVVGDRDAVRAWGVEASEPSWVAEPPREGDEVQIQVRYRHGGVVGRVVHLDHGRLSLRFDAPVTAVTPGQQLVLYRGEQALGSATIEAADRAPSVERPEGTHGT